MPTTVGIYAFCCSNQRRGWRAFAHHDGERPVSSVSLSADWYKMQIRIRPERFQSSRKVFNRDDLFQRRQFMFDEHRGNQVPRHERAF